ncbi:hypothetical protein AB0M64_31095 [Streptomyces sp. NPDC051771]|uniref:hypothetical protein n=1 Tax=Streptomyces sp. NPDC051771 TaxID=3154847 RepID=UPI00343F6008
MRSSRSGLARKVMWSVTTSTACRALATVTPVTVVCTVLSPSSVHMMSPEATFFA